MKIFFKKNIAVKHQKTEMAIIFFLLLNDKVLYDDDVSKKKLSQKDLAQTKKNQLINAWYHH